MSACRLITSCSDASFGRAAAHSRSPSATADTSLWILRPVTGTPDAAVTVSPAAS